MHQVRYKFLNIVQPVVVCMQRLGDGWAGRSGWDFRDTSEGETRWLEKAEAGPT